MNNKYIKLGFAISAMSLYFAGCGDDVLVSEEASQFSTVNSLDAKDCSDSTEGSMAFVKSKATMYVCSDGEWVAMSDHEAVQYRCESKELKDKSGFAIICDGDTIGVVKNGKDGKDGSDGKDGKNGTNGTDGKDGKNGSNGTNGSNGSDGQNGASVDSAAINKAIKDALSSASAKSQSEIDEALKNLSSASAKSQKDVDDALKNLSSATDKFGEDIDSKFNDAYSSWNAELEDKSCAIVDTVRDNEKAIITVTIRCGEAETKMEIPFTSVNENLAKVYKKHVVVRFPVQATKETNSKNIYEEIWKNLKGGENAELTVTDLDEKFAPSGKVFMQDLFASANKSFVTIEETNEKAVEYKVARLEGDLDITNLTTPVVKLRVKLNLSNNAFGAFGGFGSNATDVIYNAYADLSEESDTVVVDFLTDYKAARVKNLVDAGSKFAAANKQANEELAAALYLNNKNSDEYPAFEHFVPDQLGLLEHFNSIAWVMALIDQKSKTPGFNAVYNAFRNVFAENGNFNKAITTTYAGEDRSMFFVDYLALLIDANFFKWNQMQHGDYTAETNVWSGTDAVYYKILQNGFVEAYKLKVEDAKVFNAPSGYSSKVYKSDVEGGYFHYFEYIENEQVWYPITLWAVGVATVEKVCDADAVNSTFFYSFDGLDENAVCVCDNGECYWQDTENVCLGRNKGDKGSAFFNGEIQEYECAEVECNPSASSCVGFELVPVWESSSSVGSSSSSFEDQGGRTPEELANDPSSKLYLGTCDETKQGSEKTFNINSAELATTTGHEKFVCDGAMWRQKTQLEEKYGVCTKSVMEMGMIKYAYGSEYYKCDYLDKQKRYEWIATDAFDAYAGTACHYGNVDKNLFSEDDYYICVTAKDENGKIRLDNKGNHVHEWRNATADDYCVGDHIVSTTQKVADENLGELTFNEKCEFQSSVYVRNKTAENSTEWISNWTFAANNIPATGYVYVIFMEGYTDNELFSCAGYCDHYPIDRVKSELAAASSSSEQQKLLNIICNMGDYKRVSAGAYAVDTIAFEVEVQLSEAEIKKTYVASAKRNDWHQVTVADKLGECNASKMNSQTGVSAYGDKKVKCNDITAGNGVYAWVVADGLDANENLGLCLRGNVGSYKIINDAYYVCEKTDSYSLVDGGETPESASSTAWVEYSDENKFLNKMIGTDCDDVNDATTSTSDIKKLNGNRYKCSVHEGDAKWVDANVDYSLQKICNSESENTMIKISSSSYTCEYKDENQFYQWREATLEEANGECNAEKMRSQEDVVRYKGNVYKCDYDGENYAWVDASIDEQLRRLCSYDMAHADSKTVEESFDGTLYVCDELSSSSTWIETSAKNLCNEYFKEPLRYNSSYGTSDDNNTAIRDISIIPCSDADTAKCADESKKFVCNIDLGYKTLSYVSEDDGNTWNDVQTYCNAQNQNEEPIHALNKACEFANNKWAEMLDTLYRVYEQTEYYVLSNNKWVKASDANKYCTARYGNNSSATCLFENEMYSYCDDSYKWQNGCITR